MPRHARPTLTKINFYNKSDTVDKLIFMYKNSFPYEAIIYGRHIQIKETRSAFILYIDKTLIDRFSDMFNLARRIISLTYDDYFAENPLIVSAYKERLAGCFQRNRHYPYMEDQQNN